jgi:hypothetical protein
MSTFIQNISRSGQFLETEHGLVMVLLLFGLLTYRGPKLKGWVPIVLVSGILISIFTPAYEIDLFWPVITGLVVPPFLWQAAVAVTKSGPIRRQWSLLVWVITLLLVIFSLFQFGQLPLSTALLLGILSMTLVWYFRELNIERSYLSTVGLIALVVLLVEIDLVVLSINFWVGTLASGTAIGIGVGFLGIYLYRRLRRLKREIEWKNAFFFGLAYFAYLAGIFFQTSAITTTLAAALVVSVFGYSTGLWYRQKDIPVPSNTPIFFYLAAGLWLALGWQAHVAIDPTSLMGILAALVVITLGILAAWKIAPLSSENRWSRLLRKEVGVLLLLLGSLLFWPQEAFLTTISVEIALVAGIFLIILLRVSIKPFFDLIGVQLSWPSNTD